MDADNKEPIWNVLENVRSELAATRRKLSEFRRNNKGWGERIEPAKGGLTLVISSLYHVIDEIRQNHREAKGGIVFTVRGIGLDVCPCCFVCGTTERAPGSNHYLNNISGFVQSKEDGEKVVALFARGARLDFRPSEPGWIQVKVGACDAHVKNLEAVCIATADGGICGADIERAIAPTETEARP